MNTTIGSRWRLRRRGLNSGAIPGQSSIARVPRPLRLLCHPFHNGLLGVGMGAGRAIDLVFECFGVAAAAITAYDPSLDEDGRMARAALRVVGAVARGVVAQDAGEAVADEAG